MRGDGKGEDISGGKTEALGQKCIKWAVLGEERRLVRLEKF